MKDTSRHVPDLRVKLRDGDAAPGGLVVGFDRREASVAALESAAHLATQLSTGLHVVHAIDLRDYPIDPDGPDWEAEARATLRDEERSVQDILSRFRCAWSYQAGRGDPAELLRTIATETEALMIVVGSHAPGFGAALSHALEGSVEHRLLAGASSFPVLVVPERSKK